MVKQEQEIVSNDVYMMIVDQRMIAIRDWIYSYYQ